MFFPKKNKQRVFFGKRCQRNIPEVCFPEPRPLDELSSLSKWLQEVIGGLGFGGVGKWRKLGRSWCKKMVDIDVFLHLSDLYIYIWYAIILWYECQCLYIHIISLFLNLYKYLIYICMVYWGMLFWFLLGVWSLPCCCRMHFVQAQFISRIKRNLMGNRSTGIRMQRGYPPWN